MGPKGDYLTSSSSMACLFIPVFSGSSTAFFAEKTLL